MGRARGKEEEGGGERGNAKLKGYSTVHMRALQRLRRPSTPQSKADGVPGCQTTGRALLRLARGGQ